VTGAPDFEAVFAVMSAASLGDSAARVAVPDEPDLEHWPTRLGIALNVLLDDLAFRVSEREKAEERLRQAHKLEAIGKLAGGIAHDFNNMLSVILGYSEMSILALTAGDPIRADLEEIHRAAERARELTRQLLAFSRKQILEPKVLDLNQTLLGLSNMLRRLLGEGIELSLLTYTRVGKIKADPSQLEQVVMNLAVNARDAMPKGGKLAIETSDVELDAEYAAAHPDVSPGRYVLLAVTDDGVGIPASDWGRIFEPFFTTKPKGVGTGLGLSTVLGIVRQSGGHIWMYSEPGRGTTFKIYFPRHELPTHAPLTQPPATTIARGFETILLVEDDEQVRALCRIVLGRNGYNVLEAQSPGEAIILCEKYPAKIHLLLTDVVMPRMTGKELVDRVGPARPQMKILYMSGYTDDAIVHHGVLDAGVAFLQKPLTPDALLRKVRDVLNSA
jgi:two-component system, cell cycle sensor histidine kinase and response regulator CckA